MYRDRVYKARDIAAAPTLEDMRRQREKMRPPLSKLITYLVNHLFSAKLTADLAWKETGITDHSLSVAFRQAIGLTLRQYIEQLRLEVADRMVRTHPEFGLMWISLAVGYKTHGTFIDAYRRWLGETPSQACRNPGPPEMDIAHLRRYLRGDLDEDDAWAVQEIGLEIYPAFEERLRKRYQQAPGEPYIEVGGPRQNRWSAEGFWQELRAQPFEAQKRLLRGVRFYSTALFDLLREKSREEGRRDRRRGIELAELALLSLERSEDVFGERIHDLWALGWAWLGNAHVLGLDFSAAEAAFERADKAWGPGGRQPDPLIVGELCWLKGTLRMYQRDYAEALRLTEKSHGLFRRAANVAGEINALIQRAAIYGYTERLTDSVIDFSRADSLLEDREDAYLAFTVGINLANVLARVGRYEEASTLLSRARRQHDHLDYPLGLHEIGYVDGFIRECAGDFAAAETLYSAALSGFGETRELLHASLCALDLMSLYSQRDQWEKVLSLCPEAIASIESLNLHEETVAAIKLLSGALQAGEVPRLLLQEVRKSLRADPLAGLPTGN